MPKTPLNPIIRVACPEDIDHLTGLLQSLFAIEEDFAFDAALQRRGLQQLLAEPTARIMVADVDGETIGMCSGQLTISTAEGGPALLLEDLVVREDYRGRGIGKNLTESLELWANRNGVSRLQLLADRNNFPALAFYRKHGWEFTKLICLRKKLP
ncbi:MAG: GNAT family N-acetyltransferase [Desulfobulbaceae bacterium]|nr:GNAT family N-acetyltransferase [Desulfobulbaceae bacterium]